MNPVDTEYMLYRTTIIDATINNSFDLYQWYNGNLLKRLIVGLIPCQVKTWCVVAIIMFIYSAADHGLEPQWYLVIALSLLNSLI